MSAPCDPFNGAATLGLRKGGQRQRGRGLALVLQWSRNFRAAESGRRAATALAPSSFNGAATLGLRKVPSASLSFSDAWPSMEPQL